MHAYLSAEDYRSLVVDHCQLVGQFENLVVVVVQLWEMNNALRERLDLPRASPCPSQGAWRARHGPPRSRRSSR